MALLGLDGLLINFLTPIKSFLGRIRNLLWGISPLFSALTTSRFASGSSRSSKAGKVLTVEPKAFRALLFLLRNPQRLISKEELLNAVWGDAAVTRGFPDALHLAAAPPAWRRHPRAALHRNRGHGRIPVCWQVEVSEDAPGEPEAAKRRMALRRAERSYPGSRKRLRRWCWPAASHCSVVGCALIWYLHRPLPAAAHHRIYPDHPRRPSKVPAGTDGSRLYFIRMPARPTSPDSVAQVDRIAGGGIAPVPSSQVTATHSWLDVSPDGSSFSFIHAERADPLWNVRILGGPLATWEMPITRSLFTRRESVALRHAGWRYLRRSERWDGNSTNWPCGAGVRISSADIAWSPDGSAIRFT